MSVVWYVCVVCECGVVCQSGVSVVCECGVVYKCSVV